MLLKKYLSKKIEILRKVIYLPKNELLWCIAFLADFFGYHVTRVILKTKGETRILITSLMYIAF